MDNDGVLWMFAEIQGVWGVAKVPNPENARFKPGLSGHNCSSDLMITDLTGGVWKYGGGVNELYKISESGVGMITPGLGHQQMKTRPNLIAEGGKFYFSDNRNKIYSSDGQIIQADRPVLVFEGDVNGAGQTGSAIWGAQVDKNGSSGVCVGVSQWLFLLVIGVRGV